MAFGFLKKIAKGVGRAVSRPVRGIGRIVGGDFRGGFADIGHGIKRAAQAAALVGSGGTAAIGMAAAGGALEKGLEGGSVRSAVRGAAGGASGALAAQSAGNIGRGIGKRVLSRGADQASMQMAGQAASPAAAASASGQSAIQQGQAAMGQLDGAVAEQVAKRGNNFGNVMQIGPVQGAQAASSAVPAASGAAALPGAASQSFAPAVNSISPVRGLTGTGAAASGAATSAPSTFARIGKAVSGVSDKMGDAINYAERHPVATKFVGDAILASQGDPLHDIYKRREDRADAEFALMNDPEEQRRRLLEQMVLSGAWRV